MLPLFLLCVLCVLCGESLAGERTSLVENPYALLTYRKYSDRPSPVSLRERYRAFLPCKEVNHVLGLLQLSSLCSRGETARSGGEVCGHAGQEGEAHAHADRDRRPLDRYVVLGQGLVRKPG